MGSWHCAASIESIWGSRGGRERRRRLLRRKQNNGKDVDGARGLGLRESLAHSNASARRIQTRALGHQQRHESELQLDHGGELA